MTNLSPAVLSLTLTVFITLGGAVLWLWMARKLKEERLDKTLEELKEIGSITEKSNEILRSQLEERNQTLTRVTIRLDRLDRHNRMLTRKVLLLEDYVGRLEGALRENRIAVPEREREEAEA